MTKCMDCKNFFSSEKPDESGDCVRRVVDPRQAYYKAVPVDVNKDASQCSDFIKK